MEAIFYLEEIRLVHFALIAAGVLYSSTRIARRFFSPQKDLAFLLNIVIIAFAEIVISIMLIGSLGWLNRLGLSVITAALFFGSLFLRPEAREKTLKEGNFERLSPFERCLLIVVASLAIGVFLSEALLPALATDSLIYHLKFPAEWLKSGALTREVTFFHEPAPTYSPMNAEFYFAWLMIPFGSDIIARFAQLPLFLVAALAFYLLLLEMGLPRKGALGVSLIFFITKTFFRQIDQTNNDLIFLAFFFAFLYYTMRLARRERGALFLSGAALGLFVGTKYIALIYVPGILILLLLSIASRKRCQRHRNCWKGFLTFTAPLLLLGGYSYLRNFIETGNPFFPADLTLFGLRVFKGMFEPGEIIERTYTFSSAFHTLFVPRISEGRIYEFTLPPILGWGFVAGFGGAIATLIIRFVKKTDARETLRLFALFVVFPVISLYLFFRRVPFHDARLLFPLYGLLCLAFGFSFGKALQWKIPGKTAIAVLLAIAMLETKVLAEIAFIKVFLPLGFVVAIGGWTLWMLWKWMRKRSGSAGALFIAGVAAAVCASAYVGWGAYIIACEKSRALMYARFYGDIGEGWAFLEKERRLGGARIAQSGGPMMYPLYGARLENDVMYISIQGVERNFFHEYATHYEGPIGESLTVKVRELYRSEGNFDAWKKRLSREKIDYLFLTGKGTDGSELIEKRWAACEPEKFRLVFKSGDTEIYSLAGR